MGVYFIMNLQKIFNKSFIHQIKLLNHIFSIPLIVYDKSGEIVFSSVDSIPSKFKKFSRVSKYFTFSSSTRK